MLRLRLLLAFALIVLVTIVSFLLLAREGVEANVRSFVRGSMMGFDQLADDLEAYYAVYGTWEGAEEVLASGPGHGMGMGGMMRGVRLRLADARGTVVSDSQAEPQGMLTRAERGAAITLRAPNGTVAGYLLAEGGQGNPQAEQRLIRELQRAGWLAAAIAGGVSLLLALLLSYGLLQPVGALTRAASAMAKGDLGQRVPVRSGDALGTLATAFNGMADSLQRAEANRRAMTADIAHELRTPIAIQRAHLEALQDGVYPLTVENVQPVLDQTELLTRLVEDLRTLALADAGELRLERASTDLAVLVQRVVERFAPEAASRQIHLALDAPGSHGLKPVLMDPNRVEQILNNLVSNALRYTPEGGTVAVRLSGSGGWAEVQVMDTGLGIPPEAMPRLFERFFRADPSRSREAGGSGLGLAIARQLALAHGGDILAANRSEGGSVFTLRLPAE